MISVRWCSTGRGAHVHVRVFVNGALSGTLVFREEEWSHAYNIMFRDVRECIQQPSMLIDCRDCKPPEGRSIRFPEV